MKTLLKSIALCLTLSCAALVSHAQELWFDLGVNAAFGPTVLLNSNMTSSSSISYDLNSGNSFGAKLGINSGEYNSLNLIYNYGSGQQDFEVSSDVAGIIDVSTAWKTHDFMLLYRYSGSGVYVELGPKYSTISSVDQSLSSSTLNVTRDLSAAFDNHFSGVLGFGSYLAGSDVLVLNLGVRISYAFSDMIAESARGGTVFIPQTEFAPRFDDYAKTSPISAMINLELSYAFGRVAKENCTSRKKIIFFQ